MSNKFEKWVRNNISDVIKEINNRKKFKSFLSRIHKNKYKNTYSGVITLRNRKLNLLYGDPYFFLWCI